MICDRCTFHLRIRTTPTMFRMFRRSMTTKATGKRGRHVAAATLQPPSLRRNPKRIHEAMEQTTIERVAQTLMTTASVRILGLDINTNSTGYAVLDGSGRVATWGHIATAQIASSDILAIAHAITDELRVVQVTTDTSNAQWHVGIEDFMRMYRFGQFHNKGIFQLAQLNGIVSYTCWQRFGCRPVHTHPSAARALFGIVASKSKKTSNSSVKDQVMTYVLAQEQDSDAVRMLKTDYVNRFGQWTDAAYDIVDAYIVAAYTRWMAQQGQLQHHPELLQQFSDAYLALVEPTKKTTTVETTALLTMDAATKHEYLSSLFASGVADWIKQQQ